MGMKAREIQCTAMELRDLAEVVALMAAECAALGAAKKQKKAKARR